MSNSSADPTRGLEPQGAARVAWGRVTLFYAIAFGMVALLGVVLWQLGANLTDTQAAVAFQLIVGFLYMPMPLVAGLIVERVAGRRPRIATEWRALVRGLKRVALVSAGSALLLYLTNLGVTALLGNLAGVPGVGRLLFDRQAVAQNIAAVLPAGQSGALLDTMPSVALLYLLGAVSGIVAGFTINGVFAFGEEYGWRGVLMDELAPLGVVRANLLTGVMWGLWHAPIIALGFNYGEYRVAGMVMMCVWLVPFSFLLWRTREYSGSIAAPAIIHGAFNGSAGFFLLLIAEKNPLVATPVGLVGALASAIAAAVVWRATRGAAMPYPDETPRDDAIRA